MNVVEMSLWARSLKVLHTQIKRAAGTRMPLPCLRNVSRACKPLVMASLRRLANLVTPGRCIHHQLRNSKPF